MAVLFVSSPPTNLRPGTKPVQRPKRCIRKSRSKIPTTPFSFHHSVTLSTTSACATLVGPVDDKSDEYVEFANKCVSQTLLSDSRPSTLTLARAKTATWRKIMPPWPFRPHRLPRGHARMPRCALSLDPAVYLGRPRSYGYGLQVAYRLYKPRSTVSTSRPLRFTTSVTLSTT